MTIAYFDCSAGIAGDMVVGALCDLGLPFSLLTRELRKLGIEGYRLRRAVERRGGIGGVKFRVAVTAHQHARRYADIRRLIRRSRLAPATRELALAIFHRLALAEAKVHRVPVDRVHFHEVGAVDSIIDIAGAAIGLTHFGCEAIYASPLPRTRGFVATAHGRLPLPAPATCELLVGVPTVPSRIRAELVTPTGAAILATVAKGFGESPLRTVDRVGYGLGDRDFPAFPNVLRVMLGAGAPTIVIEANIDDMNPELYDHAIARLLRLGALDVTVHPVWMKKRRPAACLRVLGEEEDRKRLIECILRETTTFGVRYFPIDRVICARDVCTVRTPAGPVRVKRGWTGPRAGEGELLQIAPEYEDCKRLAEKTGRPLREIYRLARQRVSA